MIHTKTTPSTEQTHPTPTHQNNDLEKIRKTIIELEIKRRQPLEAIENSFQQIMEEIAEHPLTVIAQKISATYDANTLYALLCQEAELKRSLPQNSASEITLQKHQNDLNDIDREIAHQTQLFHTLQIQETILREIPPPRDPKQDPGRKDEFVVVEKSTPTSNENSRAFEMLSDRFRAWRLGVPLPK